MREPQTKRDVLDHYRRNPRESIVLWDDDFAAERRDRPGDGICYVDGYRDYIEFFEENPK